MFVATLTYTDQRTGIAVEEAFPAESEALANQAAYDHCKVMSLSFFRITTKPASSATATTFASQASHGSTGSIWNLPNRFRDWVAMHPYRPPELLV